MHISFASLCSVDNKPCRFSRLYTCFLDSRPRYFDFGSVGLGRDGYFKWASWRMLAAILNVDLVAT